MDSEYEEIFRACVCKGRSVREAQYRFLVSVETGTNLLQPEILNWTYSDVVTEGTRSDVDASPVKGPMPSPSRFVPNLNVAGISNMSFGGTGGGVVRMTITDISLQAYTLSGW